MTPFFFGANPAEVPHGEKQGLRILGHREDLAIDLMASLTDDQRSQAIVHENAPWDILTYNTTKAPIHEGEGLAAADMTGEQKEILLALITEYVNQVRPDVARERLEEIREKGLDHFRIVWAGATDRSRDHYYRIHGSTFLIEFDNIQDGANHIHSVWRDVENDFAADVLAGPPADVPRALGPDLSTNRRESSLIEQTASSSIGNCSCLLVEKTAFLSLLECPEPKRVAIHLPTGAS